MTRDELLAEIDRRWSELDGLVSGLDHDSLSLPVMTAESGGANWTVGDLIAHIAGWKRNAFKVAELLRDGRAHASDGFITRILGFNFQAFNDERFAAWRGRSAADILEEHAHAHSDLIQAIRSLDDEQLLDQGRPQSWLRPMLEHIGDHLDTDLRPALAAREGAR